MEATPPTVSELLCHPPALIANFLSGIYEHAAWVSEELVHRNEGISSISTITQLSAAMKNIVDAASQDDKIALLRAHPDLCERVGKLEQLTLESQEEQSRAGLQSLTAEQFESFTTMNSAYRTKFEFPFILAVRNATKYTVLAALEGRLPNSVEKEIAIALEQVHKIAWMRLLAKINSSDAQGFLTCHVLDTANGCPASKMRVQLDRHSPPELAGTIGTYVTGNDGRLEGGPPLKGGNQFVVGVYEWKFFVADYFASKGTFTSGIPFVDVVPIRFGIDNPDEHYHVPLLVSPWSFSTYRGS